MINPSATQSELFSQLAHNQMPLAHSFAFISTQIIPFVPLQTKLDLYSTLVSVQFPPFPVVISLIVLSLVAAFIVVKAVRIAFAFWTLSKTIKDIDFTCLELVPPHTSMQSPFSTAQLFNVLHGLKKTYSFEITSTRKEGIRYLVRTPSSDMEIVRKALVSYLPGVKVSEASDYLPDASTLRSSNAKIINLTQSGSFYFPLRQQRVLKEHDPIAYLTGSMTKLRDDEMLSMQLVVSPASKKVRSSAIKAESLLMNGEDPHNLIRTNLAIPLLPLKVALFALFSLFTLPLGFVISIFSGGRQGTLFPHKYLLFPNKKILDHRTTGQEELSQEVLGKVREPLFEVSFRTLFLNETSGLQLERERGLLSSLSLFTNSTWQSFKKASISNSSILLTHWAFKSLPMTLFKARSALLSPKLILSSSELSDLYHFPYSTTTETEDLVKSRSKDLPAPLSLKNDASNLDLIFGTNSYGGQETPIGLTKEERRYHTYIIGATGTGKSTMLSNMIVQDIKNGKGLAVIDPHGDLINTVLSEIPEERINDVVLLNPDDEDYPIGLNIMEISQGGVLSESREKDFIVSSLVSLFQKLYPPKSWGTRMEYILRNSALTALELKDPTIFTIQRLLTEKDFRNQATATLKPGLLKKFWDHEFKMAGDSQKIPMILPITKKEGGFFCSGIARNMIGPIHSTIDF